MGAGWGMGMRRILKKGSASQTSVWVSLAWGLANFQAAYLCITTSSLTPSYLETPLLMSPVYIPPCSLQLQNPVKRTPWDLFTEADIFALHSKLRGC